MRFKIQYLAAVGCEFDVESRISQTDASRRLARVHVNVQVEFFIFLNLENYTIHRGRYRKHDRAFFIPDFETVI